MADSPRPPQRIALRTPPNSMPRKCSCGARVQWATTVRGRRIPVEIGCRIEQDGDVFVVLADDVHFARCPDARKHRKREAPPASASEDEHRRLVHELRAQLADSVPKATHDRAVERAQRARYLLGRALVRLREPGADLEDVEQWLDDAVQRMDSAGVQPYVGSGRYKGD